MFGYYYPDADEVLADPNGRVIIADGRNHLELVRRSLRHHRHRPAAARSRAPASSVISSLEYYEAGRDHLTDGGVMMQWMPYGTTGGRLQGAHPHLRDGLPARHRGPRCRRLWLLHARARSQPISLDPGDGRDGPRATRRPRGHLERLRLTRSTVDDWVELIDEQTWLVGDEVKTYAGDGPLITDDRPRPEYFLLRRS